MWALCCPAKQRCIIAVGCHARAIKYSLHVFHLANVPVAQIAAESPGALKHLLHADDVTDIQVGDIRIDGFSEIDRRLEHGVHVTHIEDVTVTQNAVKEHCKLEHHRHLTHVDDM